MVAALAPALPEAAILGLAQSLHMWNKYLYRYINVSGFNFPEYCAYDAPQARCHLVCPKDFDASGLGDAVYDFFTSLAHTFEFVSSANLTKAHYHAFLAWLCETPFSAGEQLESSSPFDVSFWPIHPTLDRLLAYKRIVKPFKEPGWQIFSDRPANVSRYCEDDLMPVKVGHSNCRGHHAYDLTYFKVNVADAKGNFSLRQLTNGELLDHLDPHDWRMDYVYEEFDWAHCDAAGYAFPRLDWDKSNPGVSASSR